MPHRKKSLRQELHKRLDAISTDERERRSARVAALLVQQPEYQRAEILMLFLSTSYEVDTQRIAQQAWADLKRVLAPRVSWEQRRMLPIEIQSLSSDLREGELGIREPVAGRPVPVADIDLVLLPGLGFDERGNRLGRGRGFYDQFLSHNDFHGVSCALALEEQVLDLVPADPTDVQVDMLVTDVKVRRFER